MWRYDFEREDFEKQIRQSAFCGNDEATSSKLREVLRSDTIGIDHQIKTPFGTRKLVYSDFTASGRALGWVENFIRDRILPAYGNTHTLSTATARQSTFFRNEARQIVKHYLNATHEDALIFSGHGTTGAVQKFVSIMCRSNWLLPSFKEYGSGGAEVSDGFLREDRWGSYECSLCTVRLKTEAQYHSHRDSEMHQEKLSAQRPKDVKDAFEGTRRICILCDPLAHHSSLLPFRELTKRYVHASTEAIFPESIAVTGKSTSTRSESNVEIEVYTLQLDPHTGLLDEKDLSSRLQRIQSLKPGCGHFVYGGPRELQHSVFCVLVLMLLVYWQMCYA
eukprot:symbB.v1.2.005804.t1/scaffold341.1/size224985/7